MSNTNKIQLEFDVQDSFVDLSKPYDYHSLYYDVVADKTVVPEKENTLYLPIKGVYFNAIMSGEKTEEYREIKETTYSKYLQTVGKEEFLLREDFPDMDFGLYDYNNGFYPLETDGIYKEDNIYTFQIRTIDEDLAKYLIKNLANTSTKFLNSYVKLSKV